jgi:DNA-binding response OmpR family regulator
MMAARILIVDDEPHIRKVMRMTLETSGYEVAEAASGEEALELLTATPKSDLVLLDERMPGIDGLETLRQFRAHDTDTGVIMVTAYASIELAVEAMKLGATDFVRKPVSPDTLRAAVDAALLKSRREWAPPPAAPTIRGERPFEVWVLNGFRVVHRSDGDSPAEHHFDVARRDPGSVRRVTVRFRDNVVASASAVADRSLHDDSPFWRRQAGLALAEYVWTHADTPAEGRLIVREMTRDVLKAARDAAG